MRLKEKVAFVTGAGSGNGAAMAKGFVREGATVIFGDIDLENARNMAEEASDEGKAVVMEIDIGNPKSIYDAINSSVEQFGKLDVLLNNAAILTRGSILDLTVEQWDEIFRINMRGTFLCTQAAARYMKELGGGSIINVSSQNAYLAHPNVSHYGASKGAVSSFTRHAACDLAPYNIRVNELAPGFFITAMNRERLQDPQQYRASVNATLLKRLGKPEELVGIANYLASDESSFVTGSAFHVNGGSLVM